MLRSLKRLLVVLLVSAGGVPTGALAQDNRFPDLSQFINDDPDALPLGIWFDAPVPMVVRDVILDDLRWLANLQPLEASADIASFLGLGSQATGAELVAWLLLQVRAVSVAPACIASPIILIDDAELLDAPASRAAGIDVLQRCDGFARRFWAFVEYNPYAPRAIARYYDDHVLVSRERTFPVVHLGNVFMRERGHMMPDRVARLVTLFHEAHHIAYGSIHVTCSRQSLLGLANEFSRRGSILNGVGRNCDLGMRSAYYLEGLMAELLLANCRNCSEAEAREIRALAARAYMRVQLPLSSTQQVADTGLFSATRMPVIAVRYIPPKRFFDLQRAVYAEEHGRAPSWFAELFAIAEELATAGGYLDEPWIERPPASIAVDPDLAMRWLAAARDDINGHNVPLTNVPACDQTPVGCREGWWEQVPTLENGGIASFALGPGTEVELARIEIGGEIPARLTLSVEGDGHGALLYMCHIESARCVMRVIGEDGEIVRWPDAALGSYAVWIDGFGTEAAANGARPLALMARW